MSGIVGIYYLDGRPVDLSDLEKMTGILAHRGPDGEGIWHKGSVGLGHRMLWTTPESLEEQLPLVSRNGDLVITADARIDNRNDIIASLNITDRRPAEITDSELILAAYEKWDEHCPEKLLGDFAFAIWDDRKQKIFCARDHFGIKSFYYYLSDRVFAFASEIKALLCLPEVPCLLNEMRVAKHLVSMFDDTSITFYEDIFRLPPAHSITVSCDKANLRCYWALDPSRELRLGSNEEYAEAFREIFTEAVRSRLRSAFPVGSFLSGGMDSSSITCVARDLFSRSNGQPLHTFSLIFDEMTECDERFFINAVLAQGGLEPHYVRGDQISPLADIDRVHWHFDEAIFSGNLFTVWALNKSAKRQNIRIVFEGYDGDSTVSHGTGYLVELARSRRWVTLTREASGYAKHFNLSPGKLVWYYLLRYGLGRTNIQVLQSLRRKLKLLSYRNHSHNGPGRMAILNPNFVHRIGLEEVHQNLRKTQPGEPLTQRHFHYRRLTQGFHPQIQEYHDKAAAACGIEKRFPFWDRRLVEFCLSLPPEQKLYQGWDRMVLRRAMAGILPKEVQWRAGKGNLSPNFENSLLTFDRQYMRRVIFENSGTIDKYVDITVLRKAYRRFVSREGKEADTLTVWKAISLGLWLQQTGLAPK